MVRFSACAVLVFGGGLGSGSNRVLAQEAAPSPASAWQRLKDGNARFATDKPSARDIGGKRRAELVKGQQPGAVILSCADSRVVPEYLFDQGLGDLFVLRVAGNISDAATVGSTEYAIMVLKTPLIVVLGHEDCGAVQAAIDGKPLTGDLGWLVKQVNVGSDPPRDKRQALAAATRANAVFQAGQLLKRSAVIKEFVAAKRVQIVAGYYSLSTGKVEWLDLPEAK